MQHESDAWLSSRVPNHGDRRGGGARPRSRWVAAVAISICATSRRRPTPTPIAPPRA
jgi:hypothetical protein